MIEDAELYEQDFVSWTELQASRIRAARDAYWNLPIDWENVAEEIEDLGKSRQNELRNHVATIIEHLLKLQHSPARDPRPGWAVTVARARIEVEKLLEESPSLRTRLEGILPRAARNAAKVVRIGLLRHGELPAGQSFTPREFTLEDLLGDWLPED